MSEKLIVPGRKSLPGKIDKTSVGLAMQLLNLLQKGLTENLWPSYVVEYRQQGLQDDLATAYHLIAFSSSRGFILGLKAGEAAIGRALHDADQALQAATDARERGLEYAGPSMDDAVQRKKGAEQALARLREVLEKQKPVDV